MALFQAQEVNFTCAQREFKKMSKEALGAMKAVIDSSLTGLIALEAQARANMVSYDITLVPMQLKRAALQAVIDSARQAAKVIPKELALECSQLGRLNTDLENSVMSKLEGAQNAIFEIDNIIAEKASMNAEIGKIVSSKNYLEGVKAEIDKVLSAA